jgi:hypothetical protein
MNKIIILILSSPGDIYLKFKELQIQYLSLFIPLIKFYFIEFNELQNEDVIEKNNTLTFKGNECITPGMIIKTSLAINYLKKYDYDFIFRTNLSTVINIHKLIRFINKHDPNKDMCTGFIVRGFITGTGIIMNKNVANIIANNYHSFNYLELNEDSLISQMFSYFNVEYVQPYECKWGMILEKVNNDDKREYIKYYITNNKYKKFVFDKDILHYRIKNDDRNIDLLFFKDILEQLYGIKN